MSYRKLEFEVLRQKANVEKSLLIQQEILNEAAARFKARRIDLKQFQVIAHKLQEWDKLDFPFKIQENKSPNDFINALSQAIDRKEPVFYRRKTDDSLYQIIQLVEILKEQHPLQTYAFHLMPSARDYSTDNLIKKAGRLGLIPYNEEERKQSNFIRQAVTDHLEINADIGNEEELKQRLSNMKEKILKHRFECHGGGNMVNNRSYSDAAIIMLNEITKGLSKDNLSIYDYLDIMDTIKKELKNKRVTTFGFFGYRSRDQTTVQLYDELFSDAGIEIEESHRPQF